MILTKTGKGQVLVQFNQFIFNFNCCTKYGGLGNIFIIKYRNDLFIIVLCLLYVLYTSCEILIN